MRQFRKVLEMIHPKVLPPKQKDVCLNDTHHKTGHEVSLVPGKRPTDRSLPNCRALAAKGNL